MAWVGTVIGGLAAGANVISGLNQKSAANELAASNKRPVYTIPTEYEDNVNLAKGQAMTGFDEGSLNYYSGQADRGLAGGINSILNAGGSFNNLADLYNKYDDGNYRTAVQDSLLKTQHLNTLIDTTKELAGQKTQQWAMNEYEPYKDKAKLASQEAAAGSANISKGINGIGSIASDIGLSKLGSALTGRSGGSMTMGELNGSPELGPASGGQWSMPAAHFATSVDPAFTTPGGLDFLTNTYKSGPDSPEMSQLLDYISKTKI